MDRCWLFAAATEDGGPPQTAGIFLDHGCPRLAAVVFGYTNGSSDTTVAFTDDAAAGVFSIDVVDRDGDRRSRAFLNLDRDGILLCLVAILDTTHPATRNVFVVIPAPRPGAAAAPPPPFLLHDLPPIVVEQVLDYVLIDIPPPSDEEEDNDGEVIPAGNEIYVPPFGGNNMPNANNLDEALFNHIIEIVNLLPQREGVLELNLNQWAHIQELFVGLHEHITEEFQIQIEDLLEKRRFQRIRTSKKLMLNSFLWNVGVSFISHLALYLVSCHFNETNTNSESASPPMPAYHHLANAPMPALATNSSLLLSWGIEVISPAVLVMLVWLVKSCVIEREIQLMTYSNNNLMNFFVNSISKIVFFAIKEFPLISNTSLVAHLCSFAVDCFGALLLLMKHGYWDPDVADS